MSRPLEMLKADLACHLADIADMLPPKYKLTLVCRHTSMPDAQIIVTDDDIELAIDAMRRPVADVTK